MSRLLDALQEAAESMPWFDPRPVYLFPPLVREMKTETEAWSDPRWLAWQGIDHQDQDEMERTIAARIRRERAETT